MEKSREIKELPISFGKVNEKNTDLLKAFNLAVFPVTYAPSFYQALPTYEKFTKLGKRSDLILR